MLQGNSAAQNEGAGETRKEKDMTMPPKNPSPCKQWGAAIDRLKGLLPKGGRARCWHVMGMQERCCRRSHVGAALLRFSVHVHGADKAARHGTCPPTHTSGGTPY